METFRDTMTHMDLISSATLAVTAGQWIRLGAYVVPAGEMVSVGFGSASGQENATGRFYALIKNAAVEIKGKMRISVYSPQDRPIRIIHEFRCEVVNQNATDRTKQLPFPEDVAWISEDKKLVFEFLPDTTDAALTKSTSVILMDVTKAVV